MNKKTLKYILLLLVFVAVLPVVYFVNLNSSVEELYSEYFVVGDEESFYFYKAEVFREKGVYDEEVSLSASYEIFLEPGQNYNGLLAVANGFNEVSEAEVVLQQEFTLLNGNEDDVIFPTLLLVDNIKSIESDSREFFSFNLNVPKDINYGVYNALAAVNMPYEIDEEASLNYILALGIEINLHVVEDASLYESVNLVDEINNVAKTNAIVDIRKFIAYFFGIVSFTIVLFLFFKKK